MSCIIFVTTLDAFILEVSEATEKRVYSMTTVRNVGKVQNYVCILSGFNRLGVGIQLNVTVTRTETTDKAAIHTAKQKTKSKASEVQTYLENLGFKVRYGIVSTADMKTPGTFDDLI